MEIAEISSDIPAAVKQIKKALTASWNLLHQLR